MILPLHTQADLHLCWKCLQWYMSGLMRKPAFCICETKMQISLTVNAKLISAFVSATQILQPLYFLNLKFQASSHLLLLYSLVCVGPGRKPQRLVFSQRGSYDRIGSYDGAHTKSAAPFQSVPICLLSIDSVGAWWPGG